MIRITALLISLFSISAVGCVSSKKAAINPIEYVLFDSLSKYLEMKLPNTKMERERSGIIVDAKMTSRMYRSSDSVTPNIVEIGIVRHARSIDLINVFEKSDRYISIGGFRYPVYIMYLENLFDSGEYSHNRSYCTPPLTDLYEVVKVDFEKKRFYTE